MNEIQCITPKLLLLSHKKIIKNVSNIIVFVVVLSVILFTFHFLLFLTHYCGLPFPKTEENKFKP